MRITVNLASRPFVELRPVFARLRMTMGALAVLAIVLMAVLHSISAKATAAEGQMDALKAQTADFQIEQQRNEARMRQPENAAVLNRSKFLNDLFAKKSFSWTAVMMDLEDVLPAGVQVTSIEPLITAGGDVTIRMKVTGDRDRAIQFVRNLEASKRFQSARLSDESMQSQEQQAPARPTGEPGGVVFDILAGYNPLPAKQENDADVSTAKAMKAAKPKIATSKVSKPKAAKGGAR